MTTQNKPKISKDLLKRADANTIDKEELATSLSSLLASAYDNLTDRERDLAFNILKNIISEVAGEIRLKLSDAIAKADNADHDIIKLLAMDSAEIALPVLKNSSILNDKDLIEVIKLRTCEHHMAIATRQSLSEDVSEELVDTGDEGVILNLLHNQGAQISQETMSYLVEESRRVDSFQNPILHRDDLEENLAKRMFLWVSEAMRDHIVDKYDIEEEEVFRLLESASQLSLDDTRNLQISTPKPARKLAKKLKDEQKISPNMLNAALMDGETSLFFSLFSEMAELDEKLIKEIVFEESGKRMLILCKAMDIPEFQFGMIYRTSRQVQPQLRKRLQEDLNMALQKYRKIDQDKANVLVQNWQNTNETISA